MLRSKRCSSRAGWDTIWTGPRGGKLGEGYMICLHVIRGETLKLCVSRNDRLPPSPETPSPKSSTSLPSQPSATNKTNVLPKERLPDLQF